MSDLEEFLPPVTMGLALLVFVLTIFLFIEVSLRSEAEARYDEHMKTHAPVEAK